MKKDLFTKLLSAVIFLVSFTSCSSKDDNVDYAFLIGDNYLGQVKEDGVIYSYNKDNTAYVLSSNKNAKNIKIKDKITQNGKDYVVSKIFTNAFKNYESLKQISLPDTITSIANSAFENCTSLSSIDLPTSLVTIEEEAFSGCESLENVYIPSNVSEIGFYAFTKCYSLISFDVDINNKFYKAEDGILYNKENSLVQYPLGINQKDITIKNGVNVILDGAFAYDKTIENIDLNEVIEVGSYAFSHMEQLTNVTFTDSVLTLDEGCFAYCNNLHYVDLNDNLTSIGNFAFYNCTSLYGVYIPGSVADVGKDVFADSISVIIYISKDINTDNWDTRWNSSGYKVYRGISGTNVGIIDGIVYQFSGNDAYVLGHTKIIENLIILSEITYNDQTYEIKQIKQNAFTNDVNIKTILLGPNISSIDTGAFNECTSLESLIIYEGKTAIEYNAFNGCTSLNYISLGNNIRRISSAAFIDVPLAAYNIYNGAYYLGVKENKDLGLKSNPYLYLIKSQAKNITSCNTHVNTQVLADEAFYNCVKLSSLTLHNNLTYLGNYSLYYTSSLKSITYTGTKDEWSALDKGTRWNYSELEEVECSDGITTII